MQDPRNQASLQIASTKTSEIPELSDITSAFSAGPWSEVGLPLRSPLLRLLLVDCPQHEHVPVSPDMLVGLVNMTQMS